VTIEASGPATISTESPTVQFTANPTIGLVPLAVQFNCPSVDSCTNRITVWRWDFDDGGRSTNQNPPPHVFTKAGRYYPNLDATNANGDAVDGSGPSIVVASHSGLVINGDFETGDFFAWTKGGMNNYSTVGTNDGEVNSGDYGAQLLGMSFSVNTLAQALVTTPGTNYLLSFWLDNPPGNNLNQLTVSWGGNTVWGVTNLAAPGWTNVQVTVTASATNTVLQLDDVDVENVFVRFTATPAAGVAPLPVQFTSPTSDNNHKTISGWYWDFGDGTASTAPNPMHTYLAADKYMPQLTATNSDGGTVIGVGPAIVVSLPAAQFGASPASGVAPLPVQFAGPANNSGGNAITHWRWDFGDGAASAAQNPLHTYIRSGNFSPALVVTDNYGVTLAATGTAITVLRACGLVLNGGFEAGFSGWTCGAQVGPSGSLGYLSQTLATTPGANYRLSLWLDSPDGAAPNEFSVSWNGTVLFDQSSLPAIGWTNLQFLVTATGASTVLQLGFRNDVHYLGLDDISVMPAALPQPGLACVSCAGANLVLGGNNGMGGGTYRVLMSTELARPLNQWMPIATNCPDGAGDFTITLTNAIHSYAPQRFYILQAQ
jgi:PKD repeat protein